VAFQAAVPDIAAYACDKVRHVVDEISLQNLGQDHEPLLKVIKEMGDMFDWFDWSDWSKFLDYQLLRDFFSVRKEPPQPPPPPVYARFPW
jgi:hypothetical protein